MILLKDNLKKKNKRNMTTETGKQATKNKDKIKILAKEEH